MADGNPAMQATAHVALTEVSGHDYGNNLEAWREFAQNGTTEAPEISVAENCVARSIRSRASGR